MKSNYFWRDTAKISLLKMTYPNNWVIAFHLSIGCDFQARADYLRKQTYSLLSLKILKDHMDSDPDLSMLETPDAKEAIKTFKQEKAMSEANFKEELKEDAHELPLGDEVPLAFKLTYNLQDENLHLGIQPQSGQGINMVINRQINTTLVQLILGAARKGEWRLEELLGANQLAQNKRVIN